MENITTPSIKIDGKIILPKSPTMKVWRKFLEFREKDEDELKQMTLTEYTDAHIDLIVTAFNREEVTPEKLNEVLNVSDVKPLTAEIFRWLQAIFFLGLEKIPNAETGTD